ncbi:ATP-binding protein, partial [[Ruminococcus] gnavus]|uniref:ATP-binding protein n=1 Tax=Mediterraneibacter gnavus TaxID=33038 RepID=UPI00156E1342
PLLALFSEKSSQIKLQFIKSKSEYIVSVIDNGKGFSKESLQKATQKFYSENKARSGSHYGLGLSIVEKIMNEHGGLLQIENLEVDNIIVGAKVSLIFPLKSNVHEKLS